MHSRKIQFLLTVLLCALFSLPSAAQLTTGDLAGTVTDPSGAIVPNATVTLKNNATGATQTRTSNATGAYRFALVDPGTYTVSGTGQGFSPTQQAVTVSVGQTSTVNIQLTVAAAAPTTVEVTAGGGLVQTEGGNVSTTFSPTQIAAMPNPGNDLTYYVQTAPGATMNTQAGFGNVVLNGISGTSNLYTVDGLNEIDPFLNLNNSGATNLLLGSNDISTATVVNNGYNAQYGQLAGANVNYVTKSGTNRLHGNAEYFWNGRTMNANDWFNNSTTPATPRPFVNANQWAASIGGPIVKDKTFFFVDNEGLRLLIPLVQPVNVPSPQFQAATLANLASNGNSAEIPFYNNVFSLYNNAPGVSRAANVLPGGGCDGSVTLAGGAPCALQYQSSINNLTTEWLLAARVDQNFGPNDRAFIHFRTDHGQQATYADPLTPILNAQSIQPQYEGEIQENHTFGPNSVNQFLVAGSWYSAVFQPPNISTAVSTMPYSLSFAGGAPNGFFYAPGGVNYSTWPQGRHTTNYQVEDDFSWQKGNHSLKFGVNFRRNDVTDYAPGGFFATIPQAVFASQSSFFNGTADTFEQAFNTRATEPIALYTLGLYAQDEWAIKHNLKLTFALRAEHNSNPICVTNCFARLTDSFDSISHDPTQPYNQAIRSGLHQALPGLQNIAWEPRFGFAWQPFNNGSTVIRGGIGIFADVFPALLTSSLDTNSPVKNTFISTGLQVAPGLPGSAQTATTAANAALVSGFNSGLNIGQIEAGPGGASFSPPIFFNTANNLHYPIYDEWNLGFQQAIGSKMSLNLSYVGNHGSYLSLTNAGLNAFCNSAALPFQSALTPCTSALGIAGFNGLPTSPTDPRFSTVTEFSNPGISNYNGLTVGYTIRFTNLQVQANYTWSHALDDVSNGGFLPFNLDSNLSVLGPQNPFNFRQYNYGNADYDSRHQVNLNYVYDTAPHLHGWMGAVLDWTVSGTIFARSGLPFTVIDSASTAALAGYNFGPPPAAGTMNLFANSFGGPMSCSSSATTTPCFTSADFASPVTPGAVASFGNQRRNQVYGPRFFDTDLTLMKNFHMPHWESAKLSVGAQAFNLFNHPNFDQPTGDVASPNFGSIVRTIGPPTSTFGSFLGGDASPRAVQIRAQLQF